MPRMTRRTARNIAIAVALGATIGFLLRRVPPEEEYALLPEDNPTKPTDGPFSAALWSHWDRRMGDTSTGLPERSSTA